LDNYDYFERLKGSLEQAASHAKGDDSRVRVNVRKLPIPEYRANDVQQLRIALNLSQKGFAYVLGVSARTVESWEIGRNNPNGSARNLLYLIDNNRELANQLIIRQ